MNDYIATTSARGTATLSQEAAAALAAARSDAGEFGIAAPSHAVGGLLTTLAATGANAGSGAVAVTPAAGVVGLHLLAGLPEKSTVTCIDPEAEHQARAKETFRAAGYSPSRARFLPSRPLEVLGRLAAESYHLIYADVEAEDFTALIDATWPLLARSGTLVIAGSLLDGTVADASRTDRTSAAARGADEYVDTLEGAVVTRLPLDSGLTLLTRR